MRVSPQDEKLHSDMDRYGAFGWEVISARRTSDGNRENPTMSYEFLMKRRRSGGGLFFEK